MNAEHRTWISIMEELSVDVIAPFNLNLNGINYVFTALLPKFGSSAGMVVDPDWLVIKPHVNSITLAGYGYSCIEINGSTSDEMQEVLREWGWNGSSAQKPDWL